MVLIFLYVLPATSIIHYELCETNINIRLIRMDVYFGKCNRIHIGDILFTWSVSMILAMAISRYGFVPTNNKIVIHNTNSHDKYHTFFYFLDFFLLLIFVFDVCIIFCLHFYENAYAVNAKTLRCALDIFFFFFICLWL